MAVIRRPRRFDLRERVRAALRIAAPASAAQVCAELSIPQPTFSRIIRGFGQEILRVGEGRSSRYALRREIQGLGHSFPLFAVNAVGAVSRVGILGACYPRGFIVSSEGLELRTGGYPDLPWFLDDLRPAGFLGRLVGRQYHHELGVSDDIRTWSSDITLRFLTSHAVDSIGNLLVGDAAVARYLAASSGPTAFSESASERIARYERLAEEALGHGHPGSSAAGEYPKFLTRRDARTHVLVKFTRRGAEPDALRRADLLYAEALALQILTERGMAAARAQVLTGHTRHFLEVERFDRIGAAGRRGLVSFAALGAHFVGIPAGWIECAAALRALQLLSADDEARVRRLYYFGVLIGNNDMHLGNLSCFLSGDTVEGLAPAYDVLPAQYSPVHDHVPAVPFAPTLPAFSDLSAWDEGAACAARLWAEVAERPHFSADFRAIAAQNLQTVRQLMTVRQRVR